MREKKVCKQIMQKLLLQEMKIERQTQNYITIVEI